MFSVSPKVALARVIHWALLLGQQGRSLAQSTIPAETTVPSTLVGKSRPARKGGPMDSQLDRSSGVEASVQRRLQGRRLPREGPWARLTAAIAECQAV